MVVKLQSSTMTQLQNEITTSHLPQVFQDAITVAQHLGVFYLWIDALCIKQDEGGLDWNIESQTMDKVYSNAFLNISATMSSTGTESLLGQKRSASLQPAKISLFDSTQKNYYIIDGHIWKNEIDDAPLNERGWVFQERFSARRILHFGPRQLAWECYESEALEVFPDGLHQIPTLVSMSKSHAYKMLRHSNQDRNESEISKFVHEYHTLVHNYSKCFLTRSGDKLIAFSGIPKQIQEVRGDFYHAGVWNRTLPFDLNWYSDQFNEESFPARESSFRAPSWSWASVSGAVTFPSFSFDGIEVLIKNWTFIQPRILRNNYLTNRTYIRLEGLIFPLHIEWSDDDVSSFQVMKLPFNETFSPEGPAIELDGPDEDVQTLNQNGDIFWMPLFSSNEDIHGIIVGKVSRSSNFQRFGAIKIPILSMFQRIEQEGSQGSNSTGRVTKRNYSNGMNEKDWRGQRLMEVIKIERCVNITLQ